MASKKSKARKNGKRKSRLRQRLKKMYLPDLDCKYLFKKLSKEKVIRIINALFSTNYDENANLEFIDTESSEFTGFEDKNYVRSDLVPKIFSKNEADGETIVIEFQTTKNSEMGYRLFIYSFNHSKIYKKGDELYVEPARCITIYTTLDKPLSGVDVVNVKQYKYEEVGLFQFKEKEEVEYYSCEYPFINILALLQEDLFKLDDTELDIFEILYLYRYTKNCDLLLSEDIEQIINKANSIIKKYEGSDFEVLVDVYKKLITDIENIIKVKSEDNKEFKEVLESMGRSDTLTDLTFIRKARQEGIEEGREEIRLKDEEIRLKDEEIRLRDEKIRLKDEKAREEIRLRDEKVNKLMEQMAQMQAQLDSFMSPNNNQPLSP